jgi:membrane-associated phospholipid phosphatase
MAIAPRSFWSRANFVDRLYFGYFIVLGLAIAVLNHRVPAWPQYLALHALCLAVLTLLMFTAARSRVVHFLHDWYPLLIFIVCFEEVAQLSFLFRDGWQDAWFLDLEARLFSVPPTVWLSRFASTVFTELVELGYFSYFVLTMTVGGVLYRRAAKAPFHRLMATTVISYFLCYVVFLTIPTEGPRHTLAALHTVPLPGGPFHWLVLLIQRHAGVHGNAFPSSHVSAALVALIYAWRYAPRLGAALTPLVVLLCIGAVYDRYHYASDIAGGMAVAALAEAMVLVLSRSPSLARLIEDGAAPPAPSIAQ